MYQTIWLKSKGRAYQNFYWHRAYASFSVSSDKTDSIEEYIRNHASRHKSKNFKEEFKNFIDKYKMEYDEKYLWD